MIVEKVVRPVLLDIDTTVSGEVLSIIIEVQSSTFVSVVESLRSVVTIPGAAGKEEKKG
jgi:hypothetical protein